MCILEIQKSELEETWRSPYTEIGGNCDPEKESDLYREGNGFTTSFPNSLLNNLTPFLNIELTYLMDPQEGDRGQGKVLGMPTLAPGSWGGSQGLSGKADLQLWYLCEIWLDPISIPYYPWG